MRCPGNELTAERYGERVHLTLSVREDHRAELVASLADLGLPPPHDGPRGDGPHRDSGPGAALDCRRPKD